ncbi:MAG TPA: class I SAM-dependent methyltransferase [Candidatus Baltobacteraceae bacterium]|nr:class I SAM-dependent methyltransferase [Candidatus Baltobacteraceae bacterium]
MDESALYDLIYSGIARSGVYREAALAGLGLPDWVVPLSAVNSRDLERIAAELQIARGEPLLDLACGLGGPGLWVAQRTGASVTGIDCSRVAVECAAALARRLGFEGRARFVAGDATATALPARGFAAVMSIDALQFMEPAKALAEIARLLRPGGRAAILTWEALADVELPTVVRDYRPYFEAAGLRIRTHEIVPDARDREMRYFHALAERAGDLRAEVGEAAEPILHEAVDRIAREHEPARVRKVFIVAQAFFADS